MTEVSTELVHGDDDLASAVLHIVAWDTVDELAAITLDSVTVLAAATEVISELQLVSSDSSPVVLSFSAANVEPTELLSALTTRADTPLTAVTEVSTELVYGDDDLTPAVLSMDGEDTTDSERAELVTAVTRDLLTALPAAAAAAPEVTITELLLVSSGLSPVLPSVNGADFELTDDLPVLTTAADIITPSALTEVSAVVVDDVECATVVQSTVGVHTTNNTEVFDGLTASIPDLIPTEVTSELLLVNRDLSPAVLSTDEANVELTDDLPPLTTGADCTRAAVIEVSTEMVDNGSGLPTAVLSTAGEHTTDTEVTDEAILCDVTSELVHGNEDLAPAEWSTTRLGLKLTDDLLVLTIGSDTTRAAGTEVGRELADGDDLTAAALGRAGQHTADTTMTTGSAT